jgi:hypothetical protein
MTVRGNHEALAPNVLDGPDLPLMEGENPNLRQEVRDTIGDWWLTEKNVRLGGRTPDEVIEAQHGAQVRNLIRSIRYIGIS